MNITSGAPRATQFEPSETISFLLLPGYTITSVTGAIDVLRLANRELGYRRYHWVLLSEDEKPVFSSTDMQLGPTRSMHTLDACELLMVCGGERMTVAATDSLITQFRRVAPRAKSLGAMCTGSYLLARAGMLNGYRASIHWETLPAVTEEFSSVYFGEQVFVIDRDRLTCAGGIGSLDLMLAMLGGKHGHELAARISEQLIVAQLRSDHDHQLVPLYAHLGRFHAKLIEAATVMHANIEDPLSVDEVANAAGISRRQLERLFKRHVGQVPTRYYQQMRLRRARQLLLQTGMSIMDVAVACGFRSPPHFSKAYRAYFGHTPSTERRPNATGPEAHREWVADTPNALQVSDDLATALASPDVESIPGSGASDAPVGPEG